MQKKKEKKRMHPSGTCLWYAGTKVPTWRNYQGIPCGNFPEFSVVVLIQYGTRIKYDVRVLIVYKYSLHVLAQLRPNGSAVSRARLIQHYAQQPGRAEQRSFYRLGVVRHSDSMVRSCCSRFLSVDAKVVQPRFWPVLAACWACVHG